MHADRFQLGRNFRLPSGTLSPHPQYTASAFTLRSPSRRIVSKKEEAQAVIKLDVSVRQESGFVKVYKDGELQTDQIATVNLTVAADEVALDTTTVEFDTEEQIPNDKLTKLVAAVSNSSGLKVHARKAKMKRDRAVAEAEREEQEAEDAERRELEENQAWLRAAVPACKHPTSLNACDGVRSYLEKFPDGVHAQEARSVLALGEEGLEELHRDDKAWKAAGAESCRKGIGENPCVGVEIYITKFPSGLHADEARELLEQQGE